MGKGIDKIGGEGSEIFLFYPKAKKANLFVPKSLKEGYIPGKGRAWWSEGGSDSRKRGKGRN